MTSIARSDLQRLSHRVLGLHAQLLSGRVEGRTAATPNLAQSCAVKMLEAR